MKKKKVIILGAGPAGLSAAYELLKRTDNYEVIIIEQDRQVGGISKTIATSYGRMDLGGHRFFTKQKRVMDTWMEILKPQGAPSKEEIKLQIQNPFLTPNSGDPEKEDDIFLKRHRISRIYYNHKFFDYPLKLNIVTMKNMGFLTTVEVGLSYLKAKIFKKDETSLENFYINRFGHKLYAMFFESYTQKVWGRNPKEISASWGNQRVKGLSILAILKDNFRRVFQKGKDTTETSLIESFYYPKYGPGQMWQKMQKKIEAMGGKVLLEHQVISIKRKGNRLLTVTVKNKKETKEIKGDIFLSSLPIKDLMHNITPKVPKEITTITENLPYRDFVTVGILVKKLNLENKTTYQTIRNQIPDCWIYIHNKEVEVGRMQIFNNWSPYMVKDIHHTIFVGLEYFCNEGDGRFERTKQEWSNLAIQELIKMKFIDIDDVIQTHVEKVKKAYPAYFDSYDQIDQVIAYCNQYQNLYCIGRNGQHRYNNMDHSMMTGFLVVDHLLDHNISKENIWQVNTEQEYHEEKEKS